MLEQGSNFLRGEVWLRAESGFPERVLNLCAAQGIALWDLQWRSPTEFTCRLTRKDYRRLRQAATKLDCTLCVQKKTGVPFLLGAARRRQVLLAGFCLCLGMLLLGSFFVWDFELEGNRTVTDEQILRSLEKNGLTRGVFGLSVDSEDLRNHVLIDIPELSWIAVNVSGYRAHVQVRERVIKPELADKKSPANVVAVKDGYVVRVEALGGDKQVLEGDTVEAGQLLISGVSDTDTFGARVLAGMGKVYARTWYQLSMEMPLTITQKVDTGAEKHRYALTIGTSRIKFYGNGSIDTGDYDKISRKIKWTLPGGFALPISWVEETYRLYETREVSRPAEDAEREGEKILQAYLATLVGEEGSVSSTICSSREKNGILTVTLSAECVEQIGKSVPIPTDLTD